ncbi:MAG: PAS domain S-box protein, partial [Desulfobacterales bacterium]
MSENVTRQKQEKKVKAFDQSNCNRQLTEENLQLFKKVVESATDAIGISTPEGRHWYQNAAFDALFGDIGEDPPATLYCDENVGSDVFETIMAGGEWSGEVQMYAADGRILDILLRAYAFTNETGRVLGLVGVHTDITASKRSQELFKLVAQSTNDVFYEWNVQTDSLQWFSDISTELGYAPGEVPPTINGWIELIHPDDRLQLTDAVMEHRTATHDINYLYRVKHKNGTWRYWRDHATPVLDNHDRPVRWVGGISDITARKKAEEALANKATLGKIISEASRRFLTLTELDKSINACLADIGRFCAAGRAYLFQFTPDGTTMNNTHEWCAPNVKPEIQNLQGLPLEMFPWWMKLLEAGENIHVKNVAELAPEARAEKEILAAQNIKSVLVVPFLVDNRLAGFLGFDNVASARTWGAKELIPLRTLSEIIGAAVTRKRAVEALRQSEAQFRDLADMLPQIVFETDVKGNLTFANQNAFDTFGYTKEEFTSGLNATQMIAPKDRDRAAERIRQILAGASHLTGSEYSARKEDGTEFPVITYSTVIIREGCPTGLRGIMIDITDRKRAEQALRESEEKFSQAFQLSPDTVIITRMKDGTILDVNESFTNMTGYSRDEAIGRSAVADLHLWANPESRARYLEALSGAGAVRDMELWFRIK